MAEFTFAAEPPVIETERLVLAGHTVDLFEPLSAMWADASVVRHIGGAPSTSRESWMRMLSYRGLWPLLGYGYWALCEKSSGRYVGDLGFADFHRAVEPSIRGIPEAGWALAPWAQGRGYATEALTAALDWLFRETRHERSACLIAPENLASIRVAGKAGYGDPQPRRLNDKESLLFFLERPR
jgi:RimJ/RimL family protein N-acetyltransferase